MTRIFSAKDLGFFIRAKRKEMGLTQEEFATAAGTGIRFLSELERGKPTVQFEKALHVLNFVSCNMYVGER